MVAAGFARGRLSRGRRACAVGHGLLEGVWMPPDGSDKQEYPWEVREADADALRSAMSHYPTGVTVVTSGKEEKVEGMTANAVISVSLDPLLFLVSVHQDARINQRIREEGSFAVNLLSEAATALWGRRLRLAHSRRSTASWPRSTPEATMTCSSAGSSRSVWAIHARDH
jgi:flavin reductase (DIM6/NTAB) family NADH-FMN oxidoreductase RutF